MNCHFLLKHVHMVIRQNLDLLQEISGDIAPCKIPLGTQDGERVEGAAFIDGLIEAECDLRNDASKTRAQDVVLVATHSLMSSLPPLPDLEPTCLYTYIYANNMARCHKAQRQQNHKAT